MGNTDEHSMFVVDSTGIVRWGQVSPSMHVAMGDVTAALQAAV